MDTTDLTQQLANIPWYTRLYHAAGSAAAAYHGYKRNDSVGWAFVWSIFGGLSPLVTNAVALAEGFGKPKKK